MDEPLAPFNSFSISKTSSEGHPNQLEDRADISDRAVAHGDHEVLARLEEREAEEEEEGGRSIPSEVRWSRAFRLEGPIHSRESGDETNDQKPGVPAHFLYQTSSGEKGRERRDGRT